MDPINMNIEDVIKKWQNSNSPGVQSSNASDNTPWYKQDAEMDSMDDKFVNRRIRRKLKSKTSQVSFLVG